MALTLRQIERAKSEKTRYRLVDGDGLNLLVMPNGAKHWQYRFSMNGKRREMSLGSWPNVSLAQARQLRQEADDKRHQERDPLAERRQKHERKMAACETFGAIAREFLDRQLKSNRPPAVKTAYKNERFLFVEAKELLERNIRDISPKDVLDIIKRIEANGNVHTAHRVRAKVGEVFRFAIANLRAEHDPTYALRGAIAPEIRTNRAAITDPDEFGRLLSAIDGYITGHKPVQSGLKILAYMYMRPGELRKSEWSWINWEEREWRFPAEIMKMRKPHSSPIPDQVIELLNELKDLHLHDRFILPAKLPARKTGQTIPISDNAMTTALRNMGISKAEHCPHGFRATANTFLIKEGFSEAWIETSLAHQYGSEVSRAYNRYKYWNERMGMAQKWADKVDFMRNGWIRKSKT